MKSNDLETECLQNPAEILHLTCLASVTCSSQSGACTMSRQNINGTPRSRRNGAAASRLVWQWGELGFSCGSVEDGHDRLGSLGAPDPVRVPPATHGGADVGADERRAARVRAVA